ncbi:nucleotide sugar dehydrogenase [Candidatus Uhrbacteria bacterium]|nr:nucleotide sugar dehydrogenase [Candidatus Uhrbacteria bacterium]
MTIAIIGAGYVGLTSAAVYAKLGHTVYAVRKDAEKVELLKRGEVPFYEPGLSELVREGVQSGRLIPTTKYSEAVPEAEVIFICVGTPPLPSGEADLSQVFAAAKEIAQNLKKYAVIVDKSTVPVGTAERVRNTMHQELNAMNYKGSKDAPPFDVASCPEFLREGSAVHDTLNPDRIVIGVDCQRAREALLKVHEDLPGERMITDIHTAEMVKYASNAFLATKISFINEIANVCDEVGANVDEVARGMGMDPRIGPAFLKAGIGYGGACLVGDERVFLRDARGQVLRLPIAEAAMRFKQGTLRGAKILCLDQKKKQILFSKIKSASARVFNGQIIELVTKMGRALKLTADHPCLVWENGKIKTRLAGTLEKRDQLLLSTKIPQGIVPRDVDLIETLRHSPKFDIKKVKCRPLATKLADVPNISTILRKHFGQSRNYGGRNLDIISSNCLTISEFLAIETLLKPHITRNDLVLFTTKGNTTYCPARFPLNGDTARLIGYYISEGYIGYEKKGGRARTVFSFNIKEQEYLDDLKNILNTLHIRFDVRKKDSVEQVILSSRVFAYLLDDILNCGTDSYTARIPDVFFGATEEVRKELLKGIVRGDGHMAFPKHSPAVVMDFGCGSKELADGMVELFQSIGLVASTKRSRSKKSTVWAYFVRISGEDQIRQLLDFKDTKTGIRMVERLGQYKKHIAQTGFKRLNRDLVIAPIRSLVKTFAQVPVYSFEVNPKETFVTSGGIVVHNCFPKDTKALHSIAFFHDYDFKLLKAVIEVNQSQRRHFLRKIRRELVNLNGKKIGVLGLAFKNNTDDVRESAALDMISWLLREGAQISAYDPQAEANAKATIPELATCQTPEEVFSGAHAVLILTEWGEFRDLNWAGLKERMAQPILFDGRNLLDPERMRELGFTYFSVGRP